MAIVFFFCKTEFVFLSAVRFMNTLFHLSTLEYDGEKAGTPVDKVLLPVPYDDKNVWLL